MNDNCEQMAINSHLLQRHGILDNIIENGHVYEIKRKDFFKWDQNGPVEFKRIGLNQALSLPLFCSKHDNELFRPIEQHIPDCSDYNTQLLFSYRAICAEIRRKEINIEITNRIKKSSSLLFPDDIATNLIEFNKVGIRDLTSYKKMIEEELSSPNKNFFFVCHRYDPIKIYASSSFNINSGTEMSDLNKILDCGFIHIIPTTISTNIILGYHKQHSNPFLENYITSWKNLDNTDLGYKLTDLFLTRIEAWGLAPSLYTLLSETNKKKYLNTMKNQMQQSPQFTSEIKFNLFENIIE